LLIARYRSCVDGSTSVSRKGAEGTNESFAPTRVTGASIASRQFDAMRAQTSAPKPISANGNLHAEYRWQRILVRDNGAIRFRLDCDKSIFHLAARRPDERN